MLLSAKVLNYGTLVKSDQELDVGRLPLTFVGNQGPT